MIHSADFFLRGGNGGSVGRGSYNCWRIFCKSPPAFAFKFGQKPGSMSELVVLKVHGLHFLKLPNTQCQAVYIKVELWFKRYNYEPSQKRGLTF